MSYLSASGNVGYSGLSQISDASCASQYKMRVEGAGACGEDDDLSYLPHVNEHLFSSKFKMEPVELYTFQDADGVAGEITVCDNTDAAPPSPRLLPSAHSPVNGLIDDFTKTPTATLTNGHFPNSKHKAVKTIKISNSTRSPSRASMDSRSNSISEILATVGKSSPSRSADRAHTSPTSNRNSIISVNKEKTSQFSITPTGQSFLDVFKREMGSFRQTPIKKELILPTIKSEVKPPVPKKMPSGKGSGRGPALHEALQRIPLVPPPAPGAHTSWHAPGPHTFECAPLTDNKHSAAQRESSSDDDADMPNFGSWVLTSADDAEAGGGDARGARLAARRATLRRQVAHAATALRLTPSHDKQARLAHTIKKHLSQQSGPGVRLPQQLVSGLLASRGMSSVLTTKERRKLRSGGWSGGGTAERRPSGCKAEGCAADALPCAGYCLAHVTLAPDQRLYASCAAVFAGGARCRQPLLQLHDQTPLCAEHAWKRDNYDKISRECKPKKVAPRKRPCANSNRRAKRRRRPPPPRAPPLPPSLPSPPSPPHTLVAPGLNVCSNSSTYDSSEDTGIGGLSETEFMSAAGDHASLADVGVEEHVLATQQPPDDILDSSVLHQIPDEAFTEFFNQTEGSSVGGFAESEELARALEAVLDERVLDSLTDCVFTHSLPPAPLPHQQPTKMATPSGLGLEMSSSATS